ncbi:MAG: ribosome maturation factor RimM [Candidatus Izemoplasmatales bacterium]
MALVPIGRIVNTHGLKGEVRVATSTDFATDRYAPEAVVVLDAPAGRVELVVRSYRPHRGFDLVTFRGHDTIESVLPYKGLVLLAEETAPVALGTNEFRATDLIGLSVRQGGVAVGVVDGIRTYPQGDYLEIRKSDGTKALVPFVHALVPSVDMETRTVVVAEMEGLL